MMCSPMPYSLLDPLSLHHTPGGQDVPAKDVSYNHDMAIWAAFARGEEVRYKGVPITEEDYIQLTDVLKRGSYAPVAPPIKTKRREDAIVTPRRSLSHVWTVALAAAGVALMVVAAVLMLEG